MIAILLYFAGSIITYFTKKASGIIAFIFAVLANIAFIFTKPFSLHLANFSINFSLTPLASLFGIIILTLASFVMFCHPNTKERQYYPLFLLSLTGISIILLSQNFLSFFLGWELMSMSSFFLVYNNKDRKAGLLYLIASAVGAYGILIGIALIYAKTGSISFGIFSQNINLFSHKEIIYLIFLFGAGFGVKAALMPLHIWAPDGYREAKDPFTAFFSGGLSKLGIYGFFLILFVLIGADKFLTFKTTRWVLAWLGGITAFLGAFYAIFQTDIKRLLALSSVSQMGYAITALALGTSLGITASLYTVLSHALFKGILFITAASVILRTGKTSLDEMGGLVKNMPLTFIISLFAVIGLVGVPPMGGFPAKWLLYEGLIKANFPGLIALMFAASTLAFLYSYRFIHGIFLGKRSPALKDIKEAPSLNIFSSLILMLILLFVGMFPGWVVDFFSPVIKSLGFTVMEHSPGIISTPLGNFNGFLVGIIFIIAGLFATILSLFFSRRLHASSIDTYSSGEALTEETPYHYTSNFYLFIQREFTGILRLNARKFYFSIAQFIENSANALRKLYTGNGQVYIWYVIIVWIGLIIGIFYKGGFK